MNSFHVGLEAETGWSRVPARGEMSVASYAGRGGHQAWYGDGLEDPRAATAHTKEPESRQQEHAWQWAPHQGSRSNLKPAEWTAPRLYATLSYRWTSAETGSSLSNDACRDLLCSSREQIWYCPGRNRGNLWSTTTVKFNEVRNDKITALEARQGEIYKITM